MAITLELTAREAEVIRQALRAQEAMHTRNDFKVLVNECQDLRSKVNDAMIDHAEQVKILV